MKKCIMNSQHTTQVKQPLKQTITREKLMCFARRHFCFLTKDTHIYRHTHTNMHIKRSLYIILKAAQNQKREATWQVSRPANRKWNTTNNHHLQCFPYFLEFILNLPCYLELHFLSAKINDQNRVIKCSIVKCKSHLR